MRMSADCTICRHACFGVLRLVRAAWYMMERDDHRTYTHESAITRRMWYSTVTPTDPDIYIYIVYYLQTCMFRRPTARQCSLIPSGMRRIGVYTHEPALTRHMWYNTETPSDQTCAKVYILLKRHDSACTVYLFFFSQS